MDESDGRTPSNRDVAAIEQLAARIVQLEEALLDLTGECRGGGRPSARTVARAGAVLRARLAGVEVAAEGSAECGSAHPHRGAG
jgi:hypothetical protein